MPIMTEAKNDGAENGRPGTGEAGPDPDFFPEATPEVRRFLFEEAQETRRQLEETERFVWEVARRRGIFGISTST